MSHDLYCGTFGLFETPRSNMQTSICKLMSTVARRLEPLTLTEAAVNRIKQICESKPEVIGLRIGVKQRGCSGLTYTLDYATQKDQHDIEIIKDDVRVFINKKAQLTLLGSEMDFRDDKITSEFVFSNPNVTGTCGCGESFTVKKAS